MEQANERRQERDFRRPDALTPEGGTIITGARARQAVFSGRILVVLVVAIGALMVAFALSYLTVV